MTKRRLFTTKFGYILDSLEGFSDVGELPDYSFIQNTGKYTICMWLKTNDYTADAVQIIMGSDINATDKGVSCAYENRDGVGTNAISLFLLNGTGVSMLAHVEDGAITDNNWHFYTACGDGVNNKLYIDGALLGSKALGALSSGDSTNKLMLGNNQDFQTLGLDGHFTGCAIFNKDYSNDVKFLYNSGVPKELSGLPGLVSWWPLNQGTWDGTNHTERDYGDLQNHAISKNMEKGDLVRIDF